MQTCRPPLSAPSLPRHRLPAGACDAHCHVFGPADRFPYAATRTYTPPDASFEAITALHRLLGIERAVIVQAACHGTDHSALLDAIARSDGRYRGVGLVKPDASDAHLQMLHEGGVRAARFNFVPHLGSPPSLDTVKTVARRIAPLGWHICVHVDGASLLEWLPYLRALPVPFVVDHMGRIDATQGLDAPAFRALLDLASVGNAWVKVSGIDRISAGHRPFHEGLPFVRRLVETIPQRTLWGSDWPHPNVAGDVPDDGELVDTFFTACAEPVLRQQVLVDNPAALYGFT